MARKTLSFKEFRGLLARDPKAAKEDAERTTEDYRLRVKKYRLLIDGADAEPDEEDERPWRDTERLTLW